MIHRSFVKTLFGVISFFVLLFSSSISVEARDYHIQASDGEVYTVTLGENPNVLNFTVKDASGEILSGATEDERAVATELYFAAKLFWNVLPLFAPDAPFEDLEQEVREYVRLALAKLTLSQMAEIFVSGAIAPLDSFAQALASGDFSLVSAVVGIFPPAINTGRQLEPERQLVEAASLLAIGCGRGASNLERLLNQQWRYYETRKEEIPIAHINASWESFHRYIQYRSLAAEIIDIYLKSTDLKERLANTTLGTIAGRIVAPVPTSGIAVPGGVISVTPIARLIVSSVASTILANRTIDVLEAHIEHLKDLSETSDAKIQETVLLDIAAGKEESRAELEEQSYFQPRVVVPLEDIRISIDDDPQRLDVRDYFLPNGNNLTYVPVSSDLSIVVSGTERTGSSEIIMTPKSVGTASITVHLMNFRGLSVTESFTVTVGEDTQQVLVPEPDDTIDHQLLLIDGPPLTLDVEGYFSWDKPLDYEVDSDPSGIVAERISGSFVTITPRQLGNASVIVRAYDRDDRSLSTIQTIPVLVYTNRATIVRPPSSQAFRQPTTSNPSAKGLARGVSVIVQNTLVLGLNIRSNPWVSNNNPDNRIGRVHDGATGTITDGPQQNGGFTWWKIDWDLENKEGWSADFIQGSQIIFRRPPDLEIRDFDVSDDKVKPGEEFTLEVEIRNNGPGDSEPTEIYFYYRLSGEENDVRVAGKGKVDVPSIDEGERRDVSLTVAAPMTPHTAYDYGAILPPDIPETYDADLVDPTKQMRLNNVAEERVRVTSSPDLIVESITASKSVLDPGEEFTLEATVRNRGLGEPEYNAILDYYRSSDAYITTRDREVGDDVIQSEDLDTNKVADPESIRLSAPSDPGVYYYGACVNVRNESDTDNNCSGGVAITVRETNASDLVVSQVTLSDNTLAPGAAFTLEVTVENRGEGAARPTTLRGYRSANASISTNDTEIGSIQVGSLGGGAATIHEFTLTAPLGSGMYYYGVLIESVVNERNTANNNSAGVALTVENLAPIASGTIPLQALDVGGVTVLDISPYFSDLNEDILTYYVFSDAASVVVAEFSDLSNSELTLTPLGAGTATITIEVSDGEFTATQTMDVSVTAPSVSEASWMPDANLRAAVRRALGLVPGDVLTQEAVQNLRFLDASVPLEAALSVKINDLTGLEHATQLAALSLWHNEVVDVRPLSSLTTLTLLDLRENAVVDVRPLSVLAQLSVLNLLSNQISDVSALEALVNLKELYLEGNPISDLSPLRRLKSKNPNVEIDIDISVEVSVVSEEVWMPDANLRAAVREALGLAPDDVLTQEAMAELTSVNFNYRGIKDLMGLEHATQLMVLDLKWNAIVDVSGLSGLSQLTRLSLSGNKIVDVSGLSGLSQLTELDLWDNKIVDVSGLSGLSQLTELSLGFNAIVDVSGLSGLSQLTELDLWDNAIVDVSGLSGLSQLTELDLYDNEVVDVSPLSVLSQLTTLSLIGNKISDVSALEGLINLEQLFLEGNPITDLVPLRRLKSKNPDIGIDIDINAATTAVSEEVWMPDANLRAAVRDALGLAPSDVLTQEAMQGLTKLDASGWGAPVSEEIIDLTGLEHATQLMELSLGFNAIVDVSPLSELSQLRELYLGGNDIVDVSGLSGLSQLTWLYLGGNDIVDVSPLSGLSQLRELYLRENDIVDVSPLSGLSQLRELSLSANAIVDVSGLSGLSQLTGLDLRENDIVDVSGLSGLSQLTWLSLWENDIVDVSPLSGLSQLTWLSLWENDIVDVSPLSGLTQLTELDLRWNYIVDVSPLSEMINLEYLSLEGNPIADLAPLRRLKAKNPDVEIDIDLDADAPAAPAAPTLSVETALLPNYPNPFNPETWIPYQLSKPADVTVSIYSVDGKLVRRLALGHQAAGVYQSKRRAVYWDGRNNVGERVASGIYFYTFSAGSFTATRKMLIRK